MPEQPIINYWNVGDGSGNSTLVPSPRQPRANELTVAFPGFYNFRPDVLIAERLAALYAASPSVSDYPQPPLPTIEDVQKAFAPLLPTLIDRDGINSLARALYSVRAKRHGIGAFTISVAAFTDLAGAADITERDGDQRRLTMAERDMQYRERANLAKFG